MSSGLLSPAREYPSHSNSLWRRLLLRQEAVVIALLLAAWIVASVRVEHFSGPITLTYLLLDVAPILIMALPMTLIIVSGEIDLSVASIFGLCSVVLGDLHEAGLPMEVAGLIAVIVGVLAGLVNGFLVTVVGLPSLAVTIGTLALYRGLAVGLLGTNAITDFPEFWTELAKSNVADTPIPTVVLLLVILVVGFAVLLQGTPFGQGVYAIGLSSETAAFSGVRVRRTKLILFVLSGACAGLAGIYYTLRFGNSIGSNGIGLELAVIAAVVLGGTSIFGGRGTVVGTVAGVLLIATLASALRLARVPANAIDIVTGAILVMSMIISVSAARISSTRRSSVKQGDGVAR